MKRRCRLPRELRLPILSPGAAGGKSQEEPIARRSRWLVGRNGPLATLDNVTQRMLAGNRQVVFITGEAGIGKTSFVEMAMEQLSRYRVETLCGFCTERFGTNEAFLPLIDSLTTRCRGPDGLGCTGCRARLCADLAAPDARFSRCGGSRRVPERGIRGDARTDVA